MTVILTLTSISTTILSRSLRCFHIALSPVEPVKSVLTGFFLSHRNMNKLLKSVSREIS